jgi:hypothetical protein
MNETAVFSASEALSRKNHYGHVLGVVSSTRLSGNAHKRAVLPIICLVRGVPFDIGHAIKNKTRINFHSVLKIEIWR